MMVPKAVQAAFALSSLRTSVYGHFVIVYRLVSTYSVLEKTELKKIASIMFVTGAFV